MSREEDAIRTTTRAIAATVREVPPLRLDPAPGGSRSAGRWSRRTWRRGNSPRVRSWLAPVAAAAVVVAVAVTLVLVRGPQNGGVVPQPALTNSLPGGVPRYYVAVDPAAGPGSSDGLLMGDSVTGETLPVTPPPHMSFESVTAAADDRTFFAFATETGGSPTTGLWFLLVLAPGTDHVISYGSTAIAQQSGVVASALSASGKYLAVAETGPTKGQRRIIVFSVATGRPLLTWSTKDAPAMWNTGASPQNLLTWIDGDRAIAFTAIDATASTQSARRLNVDGPLSGGDLIADSQLIWSTAANTPPQCRLTPPVISADGQTIACVTTRHPAPADRAQPVDDHLARLPGLAAGPGGRQVHRRLPGHPAGNRSRPDAAGMNFAELAGTLWASPSGSALIGDWAIAAAPQATTSPSGGSGHSASATLRLGGAFAGSVHVGVISHGTFTPLRLPQGILPLTTPQAIAWLRPASRADFPARRRQPGRVNGVSV